MRRLLAFAFAASASFAYAAPAAADLRVFERPEAERAPGEPRSWFPEIGNFNLDLYGWIQPRFTVQQADDRPTVNLHPNPAFTVQRARLGTVASLGRWAKAQLE